MRNCLWIAIVVASAVAAGCQTTSNWNAPTDTDDEQVPNAMADPAVRQILADDPQYQEELERTKLPGDDPDPAQFDTSIPPWPEGGPVGGGTVTIGGTGQEGDAEGFEMSDGGGETTTTMTMTMEFDEDMGEPPPEQEITAMMGMMKGMIQQDADAEQQMVDDLGEWTQEEIDNLLKSIEEYPKNKEYFNQVINFTPKIKAAFDQALARHPELQAAVE